MTKKIFFKKLKHELSRLPKSEIRERISFYDEMIDDKIEDGMTEAEAIDSICTSDPIGTKFKKMDSDSDIKPKRSTTALVLIVLGFPVWFSILAAVFAVVFSLWIALWAIVIAFWAVFASTAVAAPCIAVASIFLLCRGDFALSAVGIATALACAGIAIVFFYVSKYLTIASAKITVWLFRVIVSIFRRKETV